MTLSELWSSGQRITDEQVQNASTEQLQEMNLTLLFENIDNLPPLNENAEPVLVPETKTGGADPRYVFALAHAVLDELRRRDVISSKYPEDGAFEGCGPDFT